MLSFMKLNTVCHYFSNPKMDILATQKILMFRLMLCVKALFPGTKYSILLFIDSLLFVSNICRHILELNLFEME